MNRPGDWYARCEDITRTMCEWITVYHNLYGKSEIIIEEPVQPYNRNLFQAQAIQNRFLGMMLARLPKDCRIYLANPTSVKKCFAGNGRADKDDIVKECATLYKHSHRTQAGKEAIADAVGMAFTLWQYKLKNIDKGVVLL